MFTVGDLEGVSMRVRATESGYKLWGNRVGGSTGGTDSGKDSEAMAAMRVDFPVATSPATAILSPLRRRPAKKVEGPNNNTIEFEAKHENAKK